MERRYCGMCRAPIVFARCEGVLLICDRQQTLDGDLMLREANGELFAERTAVGGSLYREHVCGFNSKKSDNTPSEELRAQDLVNALDKADRIGARAKPKRGTMGYALQVLAREVRAQRVGCRPVDDAIDQLVATCLPLSDHLPAELVARIDAVRACRRADYM